MTQKKRLGQMTQTLFQKNIEKSKFSIKYLTTLIVVLESSKILIIKN